jgi:hypothetical protein
MPPNDPKDDASKPGKRPGEEKNKPNPKPMDQWTYLDFLAIGLDVSVSTSSDGKRTNFRIGRRANQPWKFAKDGD